MKILAVNSVGFSFIVENDKGTWPAIVNFFLADPVTPIGQLYDYRVYFANLEIGHGAMVDVEITQEIALSCLRLAYDAPMGPAVTPENMPAIGL